MRKRWVSVLLALAMMLSVLPTAAFAEDDSSGTAYVAGEDSGTADPGDEDPDTVDTEGEDPGTVDTGDEDPGTVETEGEDPGTADAEEETPGTVDTEGEAPGVMDTEGEAPGAANTESGDFTIQDGVLTRYSGPGGAVVIPDGVTGIGQSAFGGCFDVTSVIIPDSVTSIGNAAFSSLHDLVSVTIGKGVTSIGAYAFQNCNVLTGVTIPNSVTSIGTNAFHGCDGLTSMTIPGSVTSFGEMAFNGCSALASVTFLAGVTNIGDRAFQHCGSLTSVDIPNSVTSIGQRAFWNCTSLKSVTIPDSVTSIGEAAFSSSAMTSVTIPDSVTSMGDSVFQDCASLTGVTIGSKVASIGRHAFYNCTALTGVTIPGNVTVIGDSAFYGCTALASVTIEKGVASIGPMAFSGCRKLTAAAISDSVTSIGQGAFGDCTSLTSVTIPNSVTSIEQSAFSGCGRLTSVDIPNSVTSIGEWAFQSCRSLTSVTIPASVTSIGGGAFNGCDRLASINVDSGNSHYCSDNGVLLTKDRKTIIAVPAGKKDASYTIPDGVTSIGDSAFAGNLNLTGVTIPDSVTSMGEWMFYRSDGLTHVTIGNGVTSIRECTFLECTGLTSVTIGSSVTTIESSAFKSCKSLAGVVIPDSVTSIANSAFSGCTTLTSVTIPASVTSIELGAFQRCTGITEFRVDPANTSYVSDGGIIFSADRSTLVACPSKRPGDYTVPESVSVIMQFAFSCCTGLTTVTLSSHITSVEAWAFEGCTNLASVIVPIGVTNFGIYRSFEGCESLAVVYYEGTREQWNKAGNTVSGFENVDIRYECKGPQDRPCPEEMTYSFGNNAGVFGYGKGYKIPLERYTAVFGNTPLADSLYSNADLWGGNCYGMATTSAMFFQDGNHVSVKDFRSKASLPVDLYISDKNTRWNLTLCEFIEIMQVSQNAERVTSSRKINKNDLNALCEAVRAFRKTGVNPPLVSVYGTVIEDNAKKQSGHALLAYDLVETNGVVSQLKVYDPNYPNNATRFITLDPATGSWDYYMNDTYHWNKDDPYGWITLVPYAKFFGVWSRKPGAVAERASSQTDENQRSALLFLNSDNAEIYDANGNKVAAVENGQLNTIHQDIFQLITTDASETGTSAGNTALYLPPDLYTVKNTDNSLQNFEATMVHVDQSAAVSTSGSSVTFAVNDRTEVNYARVNDAASGADTAYEITMKSTPTEAGKEQLDTLTVTGTGQLGQGDPSIAQVSGELFAENLDSAQVQDGGKTVSQDQLKDGGTLDVSKIAGASGEITATLQEGGRTVRLSSQPGGVVQYVFAASYDSSGRMTKLTQGTLSGTVITFPDSVTVGSQIFLLNSNRTPVCGRITIQHK